jgi:lipoprotein-anchoring transpeptidase ErfK/SrfK
MKTTSRPRKLAALLLVLFGGQLAMASAASAARGGLLGTGLFAPPPAPAAAVPAAAATSGPPSLFQVEEKLASLGFDVGPVDGVGTDQTNSAVMAFQKVKGLQRTGVLDDVLPGQIMAASGVPAPLKPDGEPNRIEVSLARQVLFLYEGGVLSKILPVATGTSKTPTPTGTFRIYRQDPGWHTSRLGRLHNAQYFIGGYAIHGSMSVPAEPASHGCIRIPMTASEWFPSRVTKGMQVVVSAG